MRGFLFSKNIFGGFTKSPYLCIMKMNDIFDEGFDSFFDGESENPYSIGDIRHQVWELGFNNAKSGN